VPTPAPTRLERTQLYRKKIEEYRRKIQQYREETKRYNKHIQAERSFLGESESEEVMSIYLHFFATPLIMNFTVM
jgi:hypothetical protein